MLLMETFMPEEALKARIYRFYRRFFSCGSNIKQQAERKGSACCFSTSINDRPHKKGRNMGGFEEIGKPLGAFYSSKSFNQPIAPISSCTSARSFFFSMSIASRYTRISFAKSPPISARR